MATITKPSSPAYTGANAVLHASTVMAMSPYNGTQQVYDWKGRWKIVEFRLPPMTQTQAQAWTEFFEDLEGQANTWNEDLGDVYPHDATVGSVAMRLLEAEIGWDISTAMHYGFTFRAIEAL
jgi:hypothetical protein